MGHTHSRRDDCIQLCYIFLYIILGNSLTWERKYISINSDSAIGQSNIYHPYNQEICKRKELSNIYLIPELMSNLQTDAPVHRDGVWHNRLTPEMDGKLNETKHDKNIQLFIVYIAKCYKLKYDDTPTYIL